MAGGGGGQWLVDVLREDKDDDSSLRGPQDQDDYPDEDEPR